MSTSPETWAARLQPYKAPDDRRAIYEIMITAIPLVLLWAGMALAVRAGYWLALAGTIPAAFLMVRMFIIQHDCGHGGMFSSRAVNDWVGRVLGVFTMTPYDYWRHTHARHHAGSGNLDRRGIGDIDTLTLEEFRSRSWLGRLKYRLYRHPLTMFVIGPALQFIVVHRLPGDVARYGRAPLVGALLTNLGILVLFALLVWAVGWTAFLAVHLPIVAVGASIGVWLFYVQHQFEGANWAHTPSWSHDEFALHGSSFYDLPQPLMWLTGYIGIHHVHHLSSRIPFHRLPQVVRDYPELKQIGRLSFGESLACVRLALWDEKAHRLISFAEARAMRAAPAA